MSVSAESFAGLAGQIETGFWWCVCVCGGGGGGAAGGAQGGNALSML